MNLPRSRAAAVVIDDRIYVVGGANGSNCLSSVERLADFILEHLNKNI